MSDPVSETTEDEAMAFDERDHRINQLLTEVASLRRVITTVAKHGVGFGAEWCQHAAQRTLDMTGLDPSTEINLPKVTRINVIGHGSHPAMIGLMIPEQRNVYDVMLSLQDNGRTLKVSFKKEAASDE